MKRYALFGYDNYYPSGGWSDYMDSFDTADEAILEGTRYSNMLVQRRDWYEVIDTQEEVEIWHWCKK